MFKEAEIIKGYSMNLCIYLDLSHKKNEDKTNYSATLEANPPIKFRGSRNNSWMITHASIFLIKYHQKGLHDLSDNSMIVS